MDESNLPIPQSTPEPSGTGTESAQGPVEASHEIPPSEGSATVPQDIGTPESPNLETPADATSLASPPVAEVAPQGDIPWEPPPLPVAESAEQPASELPKSEKMDWYILKVQSNREESIREGLRRKIKIAGLDQYFGEIIIPTEKVTEFKAGKRKVFKRKLYPGYLVVQMEINEDTWFLVRETAGIGDFTGAAGHPTPMQAREVAAILAKQEEKADEAPKLKIAFRVGDHVKIKEGTFENFEGEVANIDETNGRVTVLINIFGRSTPVDIEYWQIEAV
jgi:transcriptional antiterminator NusG